jgi:hypothetical protein
LQAVDDRPAVEGKKDMDGAAAETLVRSFTACINQRIADGVSALVTVDHAVIDAAGHRVAGKEACLDA